MGEVFGREHVLDLTAARDSSGRFRFCGTCRRVAGNGRSGGERNGVKVYKMSVNLRKQ